MGEPYCRRCTVGELELDQRRRQLARVQALLAENPYGKKATSLKNQIKNYQEGLARSKKFFEDHQMEPH